jgi:hypothetical protein
MKRNIPGLHQQAQNSNDLLEGVFLVRVERVFYRYHPQKPFFALRFAILEPKEFAGKIVSGRLYCTPKALCKLNWFLREFGYDGELLERDEVDEKALLGLRGVVKVSQTTINGRCYLNLDGFASAGVWGEVSTMASASVASETEEEDGDGLDL